MDDACIAHPQKNYRAIYRGIDFGEGGTDYILKINAGAPNNHVSSGGTMDIRLGNENGPLLGTLSFEPTGDWANYREFRANLHADTPLTGEQDICFVFHPNSEFLFNYTTFTFVPGHDDSIKDEQPSDEQSGLLTERWLDGKSFVQTTAQIEGDHMAYTTARTYATYLIDFGAGCDACTFRIRAAAPDSDVSGGGVLEIRLDDASGLLLGELEFTPTGEWANYREFSVELDHIDELYGEVTVCLVFLPVKTYLLNYAQMMFDVEIDEPTPPPTDTPTPDEPTPDEPSPEENKPDADVDADTGNESEQQPDAPSALPWLLGGAAALAAAAVTLLSVLRGKKKKS